VLVVVRGGHSEAPPQHRLNFTPLPQGQGSFLPVFGEDSGSGAS
jgi:hypothetical protein